MTPAFCRVKHDPDAGTYGDCLRACVASLLDLDAEKVPHFYHDNCDPYEGNRRLREFLRPLGFAPWFIGFDGSITLAELLELMGEQNPDSHYVLYGRDTSGGDHVVVCRGDKIVHNPAWFGCSLVGPTSTGYWVTLVIARS